MNRTRTLAPPLVVARHRRALGRCFCGVQAVQTERASIGYRGELIHELSCDRHSTDGAPGLIYAGWGRAVTRLPAEPAHRRDVPADPPPVGLAARCIAAIAGRP